MARLFDAVVVLVMPSRMTVQYWYLPWPFWGQLSKADSLFPYQIASLDQRDSAEVNSEYQLETVAEPARQTVKLERLKVMVEPVLVLVLVSQHWTMAVLRNG